MEEGLKLLLGANQGIVVGGGELRLLLNMGGGAKPVIKISYEMHIVLDDTVKLCYIEL